MSTLALVLGDIAAMLRGDMAVVRAWVLHLLGLVPVIFCVVFVFEIPLWLYLFTSCYGGAMIISLRTYAETPMA